MGFFMPILLQIIPIPQQDLWAVLIVVALLLTIRMYRGMKGSKYSTIGVYRLPAIYLFLAIVGVAALNPSYLDAAAVAVAIAAGYLMGRRLAGGVKFFEKDKTTYYKRSPFIIVIWLISFMVRFGVGYAFPGVAYIALAVEMLLSLTTGMIAGEAHHINIAYKAYIASPKAKAEK
jgi:hypothetical protein